jgi:hypothetical protein
MANFPTAYNDELLALRAKNVKRNRAYSANPEIFPSNIDSAFEQPSLLVGHGRFAVPQMTDDMQDAGAPLEGHGRKTRGCGHYSGGRDVFRDFVRGPLRDVGKEFRPLVDPIRNKAIEKINGLGHYSGGKSSVGDKIWNTYRKLEHHAARRTEPIADALQAKLLKKINGSGHYSGGKSSLGDKIWNTYRKLEHHVARRSEPIADALQKKLLKKIEASGSGHYSGGKKKSKALSARGAIVAEVMRKHGLSLPQASSYVKQHGLY